MICKSLLYIRIHHLEFCLKIKQNIELFSSCKIPGLISKGHSINKIYISKLEFSSEKPIGSFDAILFFSTALLICQVNKAFARKAMSKKCVLIWQVRIRHHVKTNMQKKRISAKSKAKFVPRLLFWITVYSSTVRFYSIHHLWVIH